MGKADHTQIHTTQELNKVTIIVIQAYFHTQIWCLAVCILVTEQVHPKVRMPTAEQSLYAHYQTITQILSASSTSLKLVLKKSTKVFTVSSNVKTKCIDFQLGHIRTML